MTSDVATRKASEAVMQAVARAVPEIVGGSGDLDPSTYTWLKEDGDFESPQRSPRLVQGIVGGGWGYGGRNIHFEVREHAMAAAANGLAYHSGFIPFAATFFVFSDYMRPSIRLAALAGLHAIFVFTHDSIGVGEDGPTHEPIEQLASLRAIPNLQVIRPCDANDTRWAWQTALEQRGRPIALVLTRQHVPTLDRALYTPAELLRRGADILGPTLSDEGKAPDLILIASGSEVALIVAAEPILRKAGQAYKGGPNSGVFLQLTCDDAQDLQVPGHRFSFGIVKAAQARGDFRVLVQRERRALRVHLGADVRRGLDLLDKAIGRALT